MGDTNPPPLCPARSDTVHVACRRVIGLETIETARRLDAIDQVAISTGCADFTTLGCVV